MIVLSVLKYTLLAYIGIVFVMLAVAFVAAAVHKAKIDVKCVRWVVYSPLVFFAGLMAFVLAPIGVMLARKCDPVRDTYLLPDGVTWDTIESFRLPKWLSWMETFDDRDGVLPGGLYEPAIASTYMKKGWKWASVKWLIRNRAYRLASLASVQPETEVLVYGKKLFEPGIRLLTLGGSVPAFEVQIASPVLFSGKLIWIRAGWKLECFVGGEVWSEQSACGLLQEFSPRLQQKERSVWPFSKS